MKTYKFGVLMTTKENHVLVNDACLKKENGTTIGYKYHREESGPQVIYWFRLRRESISFAIWASGWISAQFGEKRCACIGLIN